MKTLLTVMLGIAIPMIAHAADDPAALAEEAIRANPGIEALRARSRELAELAPAAGSWRDPMLALEYTNTPVDSFRLDRSPMSGLQLKLQQKLPEWGWSRTAREVAELHTAASEHGTAEAEVQLRREIATLFWKLALSNQLEVVTSDHLRRTQELLDAVRAQYEVGKVGQSAVLRLEVLRDRLDDDLSDFRRAERMLSAGLTRALARPADSRFETPPPAGPLPVEGTASGWLERAMRARPALARIRQEIDAEHKRAELARIRTRPDVDVWLGYRLRTVDTALDDGTDFVSAGVSVPIPWGSRKRGLAEEAARLQGESGARARLAARVDAIESELIAIEAGWARAYQKANRYRDRLIPFATATLETTLSEFAVGKADFASLYESEVDLLLLEKDYLGATTETYLQRAAARAAVGSASLENPR